MQAASGKPFAISRRVMDDAAFLYWPHSPGRPASTPGDIDAFVDRMLELTGETRRRPRGPAPDRVAARHPANDGRRPTPKIDPKIDLVLYTSAASEKSRRALRTIREVLDQYEASQVKFSTCDLSVCPQDGEVDSVVFTPTLVKQGPGPRTSIIGNLDHEDILKDLLDSSGVDRRRWDD